MSLGLEVSLQVASGSQGPVPLKSIKGQDTLGSLFSAVIAMAMGGISSSDAPRAEVEAEVTLDGESETLCLTHPVQVEAAAVTPSLEGTAASGETEEILPGGSVQGAGHVDGDTSIYRQSKIEPTLAGGEVAAGSGTIAFELSREPAESRSLNRGEAARVATPLVSEKQQTYLSQQCASEVSCASVLAESRPEKGVVSSVERVDQAGADLAVVTRAAVDVIPNESVDAGVNVASQAVRAMKQAGLKARAESEAPDGVTVAKPQKTDAETPTSQSEFPVKGTSTAPARSLEHERFVAPEEPDDVEEVPLSSLRQSEATQVPDALGADEVNREVTVERRISLEDVRTVADFLREEALKKLPRSVELRLDPPELGKVTVLLSTRGQDVAVKFIAAGGEAHRAISHASRDLSEALSERGLTLTGFSVDQGGRENGAQSKDPETAGFAWSKFRRRGEKGRVSVAALASTARRGSGVFDYFV